MALPANLSIIVTNYNKPPEQLNECMDSIRAQTVSPKEIILVDDCSNEPHAHADAISIVLPKNVGVAKARDIGVKMSSGKLLLFLDADDKLSPDFIQQCGKVILDCDIAYTNLLMFGNIERNKLVEAPDEVTPEMLIGRTCPVRVTSMMYRTVYDYLGGFKDLPVYEDWDFWVRAMFNDYTFKKANTLLWYRQNVGSRNCASSDLKSDIHKKITAPYHLESGRLVMKEGYGE
jgi:glycosyltransferase involved in cell wall biosynthesis